MLGNPERLANYSIEYYQRPQYEYWFSSKGSLRPDQLAAFCYMFGQPFYRGDDLIGRDPGLVYSIGCGEGFLEHWLEMRGVKVVGVDPSPGAKALYRGSCLVPGYEGGGNTILFVESLEHLTRAEIDEVWAATPPQAWIIIVNMPGFFPIGQDTTGWDHVTPIDDDLYDELSRGRRVFLRRHGHLVLGERL